jgi:hypothetical protein
MIHVEAVSEKQTCRHPADNSGRACGLQPMIQKPLIDNCANKWNLHFFLSSVKI